MLIAVPFAASLAQEDASLPESGEGLEVDPPLLIKSRGPDGSPILPASAQTPDLAKLENDLARAKKNAASGDRLFRAGIIAKVEAEERVLKVVRLQAALANAQLEEAKTKKDEEATEDSGDLTNAEEAARRAMEEKRHAELEAALRNLQRQQKLFALGSGRKADVNRAEKKLAELQQSED